MLVTLAVDVDVGLCGFDVGRELDDGWLPIPVTGDGPPAVSCTGDHGSCEHSGPHAAAPQGYSTYLPACIIAATTGR